MTEKVGQRFEESRVISSGLAENTFPVGRERMRVCLPFGGGIFVSTQSIKKLFLMALVSTP